MWILLLLSLPSHQLLAFVSSVTALASKALILWIVTSVIYYTINVICNLVKQQSDSNARCLSSAEEAKNQKYIFLVGSSETIHDNVSSTVVEFHAQYFTWPHIVLYTWNTNC